MMSDMFRRTSKRAGLLTNRIEAFSDGVFAIAITLLILEIAIPELTQFELQDGELFMSLVALWPKFLSFIISFGIISIFWVGHAIMFHFIVRSDRMLLWLNSLLLLGVAFIPFPAALIGEYAPEKISVILYGATLCFTGIVFAFIWLHASRNYHLINPKMPDDIVHLAKKTVWLAPLVYAIAVFFAFFAPLVSIALYIFLPLVYIIPSPIDAIVDAAVLE
ncbi:MAG: DUF1211 domain-containing protein [Candidatus Harrisonbacteria bacterium CG10_big_fil_rev_8_21_14_0_10_42_17]|uniref:DUF1211 domain-containing protein n=1 Tax=Candidatus Harrisonbacteria bacterium CG10_big_fil_rev_8_21_14_0_10_42_17 TaxID=1974584 RepID=A0A2M6WHL3_9BACT|nr:MAG: DUF1211 domain-containing protein [Candidatus Harrisonbacteria bacterium CG10_big_fil_rev_8_21_14_0_10_42_17]